MTVTTNGVTNLTPNTNTPTWLNNLVKVLLVAVPVALSVWKPNGAFNSTVAQAVIVAAGVLAAAALHLAELVAHNGLTKAGIEKTVSDEEAWVKANWSDLQATFTGAKNALSTVPGLPARLGNVEQLANEIKAKVDAIPAPEKVSIEQLADLVVPHLFARLAPGAPPAVGTEVQPPAAPQA